MKLTAAALEQLQSQWLAMSEGGQRLHDHARVWAEAAHDAVDAWEKQDVLFLADERYRRFLVACIVASGTVVSVLGKLVYQIEAVGRDGKWRPFAKPVFMVAVMFVSMAACLPLSLAMDVVRRGRRGWWWRGGNTRRHYKIISNGGGGGGDGGDHYYALRAPLLRGGGGSDGLSSGMKHTTPVGAALEATFLELLLPTLFDLAAAALINAGTLFLAASAAQMLRQSLLVFATLLALALGGGGGAATAGGGRQSSLLLLTKYHAASLAGCALGCALVAAASVLPPALDAATASSGTITAREAGAGVGLILASQAVQALQLQADQRAAGRLRLSPLKLVGCEGLVGFALTALVVLPVLAHTPARLGPGLHEDALDALAQLRNSPALQALVLLQAGALQAYNVCGMALAGDLGPAGTTAVQAARTLLVWAASVALGALPPTAWAGAGAGGAGAGERLTRWSALQAAGFALLVAAALAYARGDRWRQDRRMQEEARLIMLDAPPPPSTVAGSGVFNNTAAAAAYGGGGGGSVLAGGSPARPVAVGGGGGGGGGSRFRAHMDLDSASFVRAFAPGSLVARARVSGPPPSSDAEGGGGGGGGTGTGGAATTTGGGVARSYQDSLASWPGGGGAAGGQAPLLLPRGVLGSGDEPPSLATPP